MKYYNYIDLEIISTKKPANAQFIIEDDNGDIYLIENADRSILYKSDDKGVSWSEIVDLPDIIMDMYYEQTANYIYLFDNSGRIRYVDLSDDSLTVSGWFTGQTGTVYHHLNYLTEGMRIYFVEAAGDLKIYFYDWDSMGAAGADIFVMGAVGGRTYKMAYSVSEDNDTLWLLFAWSDENVELWKYKYIAGTFTEMEDLGANTDLPDSINLYGMAYDGSDVLYFVIKDTGDNKNYLWTYSIGTDTATKKGEYNVSLMRNDRAIGLEKAFHLTAYEIYQIQVEKQQLNLIAEPTTDAVIIGITDNFFMNNDGDMWEYIDQIGLISSAILDHEVGEGSRGIITLIKGSIPIVKNMMLRFYHNYTTATATAESIIFEGNITNFTEDQMQTVTLVSLAKKEIKSILPSGNYTKDTDGLMSQLIIDENDYVTGGTLSDGGDLGTISLGGVHSEETIFDGCAKLDGFLWYFNPTGQLFYNNGTVDSGVDYTQANVLSGVNISHVHEGYNKIKVRGAYVDGVQVESAWQEDLESQQRLGVNKRIFLISFLNTIALCNTAAANILTILAKDPLRVKFTIKDTTKGYIQVGETITFEYAASGKIVASDQFIITSATINKYGDIRYTMVSELS